MNIVKELYEDTDHPVVFGLEFLITLGVGSSVVYLIVQSWIATVFSVGVTIITFGLLYYAALQEEPENYRELIRWLVDFERPSWSEVGLAGVIIVLTALMEIALSILDSVLLPTTEPATHKTVESSPPEGQALVTILFLVIVFGPFAEELVYRGVVQRFIGYVTGAPLAMIIAATVFAIGHIPAYGGFGTPLRELAIPLVAIFSNGLMWGWLYYKTKNITVCWLSHAGWNTVAMIAWLA